MKILNFGSLNYDYVYSVDHILMSGETSAAFNIETFCGGKGLNQSVALAKAGADVWHAGMVGEDGSILLEMCRNNGVNVSCVKSICGKSGHTIIQVDAKGQNSILLFGGSNRSLTREYVQDVLNGFQTGDIMLIQNEVNDIDLIIELAYQKGMQIVMNPSPFDDAVKKCDLSKVSLLFVNEIEGWQISGKNKTDEILEYFAVHYPNTSVVLTLGKEGVIFQDKNIHFSHGSYPVNVVDTTAAGDTFTGFFLAAKMKGESIEQALEIASKASSIAVSRKGAATSIPTLEEVQNYKF